MIASLVVGRFIFSIRRVARVGPGRAQCAVALDGPRRDVRGRIGRFGAAAIIREKQNKRVIPFAEFFYLGENSAECPI